MTDDVSPATALQSLLTTPGTTPRPKLRTDVQRLTHQSNQLLRAQDTHGKCLQMLDPTNVLPQLFGFGSVLAGIEIWTRRVLALPNWAVKHNPYRVGSIHCTK